MNTRRKQATLAMIVSVATVMLAVADDLNLNWYTIAGGGEMWTTGGDLELAGTSGQPDASLFVMTGGVLELTGGFWTPARRGLPVVPPSEVEQPDGPVDDTEPEPPPWP